MVILEIACFANVLDQALRLDREDKIPAEQLKEHRKRSMTKIHAFFLQKEAVSCVLQDHMASGLESFRHSCLQALLEGLLDPNIGERLRAESISQQAPFQ
jgi:hypothetical protein